MKRFFVCGVYGMSLLALFLLCVNIFIFVSTKSFIYTDIASVPIAKVALVPGASVSKDGLLSPIFLDRIEMALALYKAKKVTTILVSGDNGTNDYNEVNPARAYLVEKGVADADIYLDHAGFDTYSSMYRARDIFKVRSMLIVTQSFHLPRSVFIARHLGIEACGVNADVGHILFRNKIREIFASEKAIFDLIFQIKPKFLGEEIPIG